MFFFFQAEDGIRDSSVTGVQTCALPICRTGSCARRRRRRDGPARARARARARGGNGRGAGRGKGENSGGAGSIKKKKKKTNHEPREDSEMLSAWPSTWTSPAA